MAADSVPAGKPIAEPAAPALGEESIAMRLLKVIWYSILLGIFLEIVALLVAAFADKLPTFATAAADTVQKLSWSMLVCGALSLGTAAAKAVRTAVTGITGLLTAPAAFILAKALHKAVDKALSIQGAADAGGAALSTVAPTAPDVIVLAVIKALEFAALGAVAAWLSKQDWSDMKTYALTGLSAALIFGGAIVGYTVYMTTPAMAAHKIVSLSLTELLYPIGCALALYAGNVLGERLGASEATDT